MARFALRLGSAGPILFRETGTRFNLAGGVLVKETVASASPATPLNWPNPRGAAPSIASLGFTRSALPLPLASMPPGAGVIWPNPEGGFYPVAGLSWQAGAALALLSAAGSLPPGVPFDWPTPIGQRGPVVNRTWLAAMSALLFPVAPMPPIAGDWPNPRGYAFPLDNRTFLAGHTALTLPKPDLESWTFDWPNPRGYPFPLSNRGFVHVRQNFLAEPLPQPINYQPPLIPVPMTANMPAVLYAWGARLTDAVNNIMQGKFNATQMVTLAANADTTTIIDARISAFSLIVFMPLTSSAAAEQAAGTMYVSDQTSGQATITHGNSADETRQFRFLIIA